MMLYATERAKWNVIESTNASVAKGERREHASYNGCRSEQHRKKQKAAAKKYRRKKPIFTIAQPIAQYADEPQEGEPSEGHQVQRQCDPIALVLSQSPGSSGSVGTEIRSNQNIVNSRIQNRMPAIAAAFGVLKFARVSVSSGVMLAIALSRSRIANG